MCEFAVPLTDGWLMRAVGEPGAAGNPEDIVLAAQSFADLYRAFIEWSLRVLGANVPAPCRRLKTIAAQMTRESIVEIETLGPSVMNAVRAELAKPKHERRPLEFTLRAWVAEETIEAFTAEADRLRQLENS